MSKRSGKKRRDFFDHPTKFCVFVLGVSPSKKNKKGREKRGKATNKNNVGEWKKKSNQEGIKK